MLVFIIFVRFFTAGYGKENLSKKFSKKLSKTLGI